MDRAVNLVYYWATRSMDEDDVQKFDAALTTPERGSDASPVAGSWSREQELAQFKRG